MTSLAFHFRRLVLCTLGVCLVLITRVSCGSERPHLLLITADDLGLQLGCYGDKVATTPAMDQFAAEGIRFTRAYVTQASCSPSRSSMLTGLYPHQNGHIGLSHLGFSMHSADIPSLPLLLQKAGYATGILGKLHVSPPAAFPFEFNGLPGQQTRDPQKVAASFDTFLQQRQEGKPFFFMANLLDPHEPFDAKVEGAPKNIVMPRQVKPFPFMNLTEASEIKAAQKRVAGFYTCVNRADECFASLMSVLEKRGLKERTLVVVIGDHGPPMPRAKTTAFNAGNHIPCLVRWPGHVPAGEKRDQMVSMVDLMPTFLAAAGVPPPPGLPGQDMMPILKDATVPGRRYLATEFGSHTPADFLPQRCIQDERWRLVMNLLRAPEIVTEKPTWAGRAPEEVFSKYNATPHIALYDLKNDPWELQNLADDPAHHAKLQELKTELHAWRQQTNDPFLNQTALIGRAEKEATRSLQRKKAAK
jgi:N-sulfoglucosamine sulfohydrolase